MAQFPKIDAVFAVNDPVAIGCSLAAKEAGRKDFFIVGVDGSPDVLQFLKDPNSLIEASAAQNPYVMAGDAVAIGYKAMQGQEPEQKLSLVRVGLITKANVDRYAGWSRSFN
jgi:ribose transport system substrate-binding protein